MNLIRTLASRSLLRQPLRSRTFSSHAVVSSINNTSGIATITLNHPNDGNALSLKMLHYLKSDLDGMTMDEATKVIVIKSSHPAVFCSGHNLVELVPGAKDGTVHDEEDVRRSHVELFNLCSEVMLKIHEAPQPVIAEVRGIATAAGCQLVATCDLAVASSDSKFATPGVSIGLFCSTPAVPLVRTVAPKHAMEMLLTGDMISAAKAREIGLINRVVEREELSSAVELLAEQIAHKSSSAIRIGKRTLWQQSAMDIRDAYSLAGTTMVDNMGTSDAREGISAFLQKREPEWRG
jgi:enoyl-CoA hydratase/carnithine racemase